MSTLVTSVILLCIGEEGKSGGGRGVREGSLSDKKRTLTTLPFTFQWSESRHQAHQAARKTGKTIV